MAVQLTDKQAIEKFEDFYQGLMDSIRAGCPIDENETEEERKKRIKHLEKPGNQEEWIEHYFKSFAFAKPAKFQIESTKKWLALKSGSHSRKWARGLSKSTRRMMEIFYKIFVQKVRINMLLISKSEGNAIRLLAPYKATLEANPRLLRDYGTQMRIGSWQVHEFMTRGKSAFRAVGADQNPRGAKNDEMRINLVLFDDIDDDEVCNNEERLDKVWNWIQKAVIPTVEISRDYWICYDNNIIAEDSIAVRAAKKAKISELVNIRNEYGQSTWPEKNSEEVIDNILSEISYEAEQSEYYNNPVTNGKVFTEMKYGKCPDISQYDFVCVYADPSTSNSDKPALKSKEKNSCKAVVIVGYKGDNYYIHRCFVDVTTNVTFIEWMYEAEVITRRANVRYFYIENNSLQNPFYEQVLLPLIFERAKEPGRTVLPVIPDTRVKPDKYFRIEGTIDPIHRVGRLILNQDEKQDRHMERMEKQFKSVKSSSRTMDGPDATEGAIHKIKEMIVARSLSNENIMTQPRTRNTSKYY